MTIDDILNYVMDSPYNTNRAVLKGLLEQLIEDSTPEDEETDETTQTTEPTQPTQTTEPTEPTEP